jgi:hypothetical protein
VNKSLARTLFVIRVVFALFWLVMGLAPLVISGVLDFKQPTQAANDFWAAIVATGFLVPMLLTVYLVGGLLCLFNRTTPLGLVLLAAVQGVIVPFDALLARAVGPWILILAVHLWLLWMYRSAYVPLWTYGVPTKMPPA